MLDVSRRHQAHHCLSKTMFPRRPKCLYTTALTNQNMQEIINRLAEEPRVPGHSEDGHEQRRTRKAADPIRQAMFESLADAAPADSTWVRVDVSFRQKRETELGSRLGRVSYTPRVLWKDERIKSFIPALDAEIQITRLKIARVDDSKCLNVRVKPRRYTLAEAERYATAEWNSDGTMRQAAARIANRLNRELFGNRARRRRGRFGRKNAPEKLVGLICQHDKGTRRHFHMLFALPPAVTMANFRAAMRAALAAERFAYPTGVDDPNSCRIVRAKSLRRSVFYNANPRKSRDDAPDVYLCASSPKQSTITTQEHSDDENPESASVDRNAIRPSAA
jgi:hypothetical protein